MTAPFRPSHVYIDAAVEKLPATQKIVAHFPGITSEIIQDPKKLKKPFPPSEQREREGEAPRALPAEGATQAPIKSAKKGLLLTHYKSDRPLKNFEANGQSLGKPYYSLDLLSNCHLECTYCILQSYLSNNPLITIYTNVEEVLEKLKEELPSLPPNAVIGTGRIADSLALDSITGFSKILVPFFAKQNGTLELKTKSDYIENLLGLDHQNKTVVSWSMNPQNIVEREEFKTANVTQRLAAAKCCVDAGYKIGFHLDPMIYHENWRNNYAQLVEEIFDTVVPEQIAWMSLGTLRFPGRQTRIMQSRFPKSKAIHEGLQHTHLPFLTYPEKTRKEMVEAVSQMIRKVAPNLNLYVCMEPTPP